MYLNGLVGLFQTPHAGVGICWVWVQVWLVGPWVYPCSCLVSMHSHVITRYLSSFPRRNKVGKDIYNLFFMMNQFKLVVEHGFRTYQLDKSPLMYYRMLLKIIFPELGIVPKQPISLCTACQ